MEIIIDFDDGRIRELSTSSFTAPDPFKGLDREDPTQRCLLTEFDLRLDLLGTDQGLRLDVYYDSLSANEREDVRISAGLGDDEERGVQAAIRDVRGTIYLATREEIGHALSIYVKTGDKVEPVATRQGSGLWLVNKKKVDQALMRVSEGKQAAETKLNVAQAVAGLKLLYPSKDEDEILDMAGVPKGLYEEIKSVADEDDLGEDE